MLATLGGRKGERTIMALREALAAGSFSVTAELNPPMDPVAEPVRATAAALKGLIVAANVTDNAAATVKITPLAAATWMLEAGLEPIMQVTTRDRNIMALQSELLGAWALGVRNILALSGDPLKVGKYGELATKVTDLDSLGLIKLIRRLNDGELAAGETLTTKTGFYVASAMNPLVDTAAKVEAKIAAGTQFFQTNIVYDVPRFASWLKPLTGAGTLDGIPVLVGVMPPRSTRALEHMHNNIPGVEVDDATFARLAGRSGDDAKEAGVAVAADVITALREVPGVAGVHIMAPGWEAEAVTRVVHAAGLDALRLHHRWRRLGRQCPREPAVRRSGQPGARLGGRKARLPVGRLHPHAGGADVPDRQPVLRLGV